MKKTKKDILKKMIKGMTDGTHKMPCGKMKDKDMPMNKYKNLKK